MHLCATVYRFSPTWPFYKLPSLIFLRRISAGITSESTTAPASLRLRIMFISRFCKLGARAIKNLGKAPIPTARPSYFPKIHNQCLGSLRNELFFSTEVQEDSDRRNEEKEKINVTFFDKDGEETHIKVPVGMSMLEAAHENDMILKEHVKEVDHFNKLPDPTDEENDMLDLAFGLSETSRLGCQIIATPELDVLRLAIPAATRNFAVDGYKPKPH